MATSAGTPAREADDLSIEVAAVAENLPVLRDAAGGVAEAVGLPATGAAHLREVVSEASTNAIDFAYVSSPPRGLVLSITAMENGGGPAELSVSVRDRGRPDRGADHSDARFGLASLGSFASSFEVASGADGCSVGAVIGAAEQFDEEDHSKRSDPACTELRFDRFDFIPTVLPRVLAAHAKRAGASVAAIAEAMVLADAFDRVGPRLLDVEGGLPTFRVTALGQAAGPDRLVLEIGPLVVARCEEIVASLRSAIGARPVSPIDCTTGGEGDQRIATIAMSLAEAG